MSDLVERLRQDTEMLKDGHQTNLTNLWHSEVVKDAAKDCWQAADEIESLRDRLEFAEFEWNRATDGMKERDATIETLRAQLAAADEHFKKVEAIGHEGDHGIAEAPFALTIG